MAKVYDKLIVDVKVKRDNIVTTVQNDSNSRFLDVYLKDNGVPIDLTGHEVRIYCKKPENGGEIFNDGEITEPTNGRCQFPLTDQTLAKEGYVEAQITIYYRNVQVLQSMPFKIHVTTSLMSTNSITSSNEYGALVILFQNVYEAYDLMVTMIKNIGVPGEIAEGLTIDTMWSAWEYLCNYVSQDLTNLIQNALTNNSVDGVVQRIGETTDTGATATAGTVMGKLNALTDFNWKYHVVQKVKGSVTTTLPAPVASGTQEKVSFGVEFDNPVLLNYIVINISSVVGGYGDRSYVSGSIKLTFYDGTTMVFGLNSSQGYSSCIYIGLFNQIFQVSGSSSFSGTSFGADRIPRHDLVIKKVEAVNWYHRNGITDPPTTGTCNAKFNVYYKEITRVRG